MKISEETNNITVLKAYFEDLSLQEIKELTKEDRAELADLARAELAAQGK